MQLRKRKGKAEINIVPLVDVLIVLIFFFLMSMQFRNVNVLNITPPKIDTAGSSETMKSVMIGVSEEGDYYINGQLALEGDVIELFEEAAQLEVKPTILIFADEDSPLKRVTFLMDTARRNNLEKIRLQAR